MENKESETRTGNPTPPTNKSTNKSSGNSKQTKITYRMLERISYIHRKIKSGCFPNTKQLAYDLESGTATISRDIEYMRDRMFAPLEYDSFRKGYFYSENYEPDIKNSFSEKELNVLLSAKKLLSRYKNSPVYKEACDVIDLLTSASMNGKNVDLMNRISVAPAEEISEEVSIDEKLWKTIQKSLNENRILAFDYTDRWGKKTEQRRILPFQLVLEDNICYLFGFDEMRNDERIFSLSRIKNAETSEETFVLPDDFEFEKHLGDSKFGAFFSKKLEHYIIDFYDEARTIVRERKWAENQIITENEYETRIEFDSTQFLKIKTWILSNGANARPFAPEWLVQEWKRNAQEMWKMANSEL